MVQSRFHWETVVPREKKEKNGFEFLFRILNSKKTSKNISERIQNLLMTELISRGGNKFLFMDSSMMVGLVDQTTLNIKMGAEGASKELKKIARAGDFQQLIKAKVTKQGNQFVLNLRQAVSQPKYSLKTSISLRFYSYQMEYYAKEIAKKIFNAKYRINRRKAPSLADVEIKIKDLVLSGIKLGNLQFQPLKTSSKPIFSLDSTQNYGNLNVFVQVMRKYVDQADQSTNDTNYSQATEIYEKILTAIRTLTPSKQRKLQKDVQKIENRILNSQLLFYQTEIKKNDSILQNKDYSTAFEKYKEIAKSIENEQNFKNPRIQKVYVVAKKRVRLSNPARKVTQSSSNR